MKKILITGSNGFIGSHLVHYYISKGAQVFGLGMSKNSNMDSVEYHQCDLATEDVYKLYKSINPDWFIHCAGNANVGISVKYPELDFEKNVNVLYKTLSALRRAKINPKFIFLSSAAVYGNPSSLPISESFPTIPISPYGLHKKMCEDICKYYRDNYDMPITILRIFSAYGEGLRKQLLWDIYNKYKSNDFIELYGTGDETRDFIHISDLIQAINLILNNEEPDFIYNIANGQEITIREIANIFGKELALPDWKISFNGKVKVGDPVKWRANIDKIKSLGYRKTVTIQDGIIRYLKWVKKYV